MNANRAVWVHNMGLTCDLFAQLLRDGVWMVEEGRVTERPSGRTVSWPEVGSRLADVFDELSLAAGEGDWLPDPSGETHHGE